MVTHRLEKVLDTSFSDLERLAIFLLKHSEGLLGWNERHEGPGVETAQRLSKQVEVVVPSVD